MTTIEITYSDSTLRKRCFGCKYLILKDNDYVGDCINKNNRVKNRSRTVLDKKCIHKETIKVWPEHYIVYLELKDGED